MKNDAWKQAEKMAANVKALKSPAAKRRQIVLWCQMVKKAMNCGSANG